MGIHYIRTKLFSIPLSKLNEMNKQSIEAYIPKVYSAEQRQHYIIQDIAFHRLFKPVKTNSPVDKKRAFMKIHFDNKGLDAINIGNILNNKHIKAKIPAYFNEKIPPVISYTYNKPIASKMFKYKQTVQAVDIKTKPPSCNSINYHESKFVYSPSGHVITGDLDIVNNVKLRELISKGPKYRVPKPINWGHNFKLLMDAVEEFARKWSKREEANVNSLSEWVKAIKNKISHRISKLKYFMKSKVNCVFKDKDVVQCLTSLQNKYVIVPADKAPNNMVFICKNYYIDCLKNELGLTGGTLNNTYAPVTFTKREIINNQTSVLETFGIEIPNEDHDLPSMYWLPKLHKSPYKQRYIAGSSKCSTKQMSILLTKILTVIKDGLETYSDTAFSRNGINQMWILKNSKTLLDNFKSRSLRKVSSISTYDFSTLYTTIPHSKLKSRLESLIKD